jgi:hypothetical protein
MPRRFIEGGRRRVEKKPVGCQGCFHHPMDKIYKLTYVEHLPLSYNNLHI